MFSKAKLLMLGLMIFLISIGYGQNRKEDFHLKSIPYNSPSPPPECALLQSQLMKALFPAAMEFVNKYTRPDGTLKSREEWPA